MNIYNPLNAESPQNKCFLCGNNLDDKNKTKEHIFPQWIINHFNLGTKSLSLRFDRKKVKYKQITIPCCKNCNSSILAPLEAKVRKNFIDLRDHEFNLSDYEVALWAGKIYYGILLYDYLDAINLGDKDLIISLQSLFSQGDVIILHILLQSLILPIKINSYDSNFPISLIHYKLKLPSHINDQFDFRTSSLTNDFFLRIGRRGFLISFDGGYLTKYPGFDFIKFTKKKLHPNQFLELAAHFMTLSYLKTNHRKYLKYDNENEIRIEYLPDNFTSVYRNEDPTEIFLSYLSNFINCDRDFLILENGMRRTYLEDENGYFQMDIYDAHE